MPNFCEFLRRRAADLAAQRLRIGKFGMLRLQRLIASAQRVVVGVRNGGRILVVIALVVLGDLGAELGVFVARGGD